MLGVVHGDEGRRDPQMAISSLDDGLLAIHLLRIQALRGVMYAIISKSDLGQGVGLDK